VVKQRPRKRIRPRKSFGGEIQFMFDDIKATIAKEVILISPDF
jgi:hypothetical protein